MSIRMHLSLLVLLAASVNVAAAADAIETVAPSNIPPNATVIDISKMKFAPATIEIDEGTVVRWTNHDAVPHNVYIQQPLEIIGDMLRAGQSLALKFNAAGQYDYICSPHPYMKGKITVKSKP